MGEVPNLAEVRNAGILKTLCLRMIRSMVGILLRKLGMFLLFTLIIKPLVWVVDLSFLNLHMQRLRVYSDIFWWDERLANGFDFELSIQLKRRGLDEQRPNSTSSS